MIRIDHPLWERFETACTLETDSPGERRRKATLFVIAILSCVMGILVGTHGVFLSDSLSQVVWPYTFSAVVGIALLLYCLTKRFALLLYSFLVMMLSIPFVFQANIGGFTGDPGSVTIVFWAMLAPAGALMFQGLRAAVGWFIGYLGLVIVTLIMDTRLMPLMEPTTHAQLMVDQAMNIVLLSITLFLTMLYFVNAFQKEHSRAEHLVTELTTSNYDLESSLQKLKLAQSELVQSEKLASIGRLAAGIAHEINNPIGSLKGTADNSVRCVSRIEQYLGESDEHAALSTDPGFQNYLRILRNNNQLILTAGERVAETVSNFISFARLDGAAFDRVNINDCLSSTLAVMRNQIGEGITVERDFGEIPLLACYPSEINQAFMNLLTSRLHAMQGRGKIAIRTSAGDGTITVRITDDGRGLSPDAIQRLFDPDFSSDQTRVRAQMGLLASYSVVQKHNGRLDVVSAPSGGCTFTVLLPVESGNIELGP